MAQLAVFVFEPRQPQRIFHRHEQFLGGKRLFQKIKRAQLRGFHRHLDIRLPGNEHDRRLHAGLLQILEQFQAAPAGHHHIGKNHVERFRAEEFHGASRVVANGGFMPRQPERAGKRCQRIWIVVDEEQMSFAGQASVLCDALVGSRGQSRRRALGLRRRLARCRGMPGLALRQIDSKSRASALVARHRNGPVMIADHRLHDCES